MWTSAPLRDEARIWVQGWRVESPAPGLGDRHWKGTGGRSWMWGFFSSLAVTNWKRQGYVREKQAEVGPGDGAASETALLLWGWERSRDSQRKVKAGQRTTRARNPRTDKQSRHLVRSRHRCNQRGFGTDFDTARISLVISSVQPVWGGCSLRKAAGTGLWSEINRREAKNNT